MKTTGSRLKHTQPSSCFLYLTPIPVMTYTYIPLSLSNSDFPNSFNILITSFILRTLTAIHAHPYCELLHDDSESCFLSTQLRQISVSAWTSYSEAGLSPSSITSRNTWDLYLTGQAVPIQQPVRSSTLGRQDRISISTGSSNIHQILTSATVFHLP